MDYTYSLANYDELITRKAKTLKAAFALEFVDLSAAAGIEGAKWEQFQLDFLNEQGRFASWVKSRQIAWSFTAAMDAVIDSILRPNTPHVFVSINLEEATEKIRYARSIVDAIHPAYKPKIERHSLTRLEFANGSRLISFPCRPVRGIAQARIYMDEMAHYAGWLDRNVYLAALPATVKGDGYIRIGSSPFGARGMFWEIATEAMRPYPGYKRYSVPWWSVNAFCKNVKTAVRLAPYMTTEQRIKIFGRQTIQEIFANMFLDDFRQEYECDWVDEKSAWLSWETIKKLQNTFNQAELVSFSANGADQALSLISRLRAAITNGEIESVLYGGYDVGRHRDVSEFVIIGKAAAGTMPLRARITLDRTEYDTQQTILEQYIRQLPLVRVLIDQNGIGNQLAENLAKTGIAEGFTFSNPSKELLAVETRVQAERNAVPIPLDDDFAYQLHSIKKRITAAGNTVFDTEGNEKHHADAYWAWALAIWAASSRGGKKRPNVW